MIELPKPWKWVDYGTPGPNGLLFRAEDGNGRRAERWSGPGRPSTEPVEAADVRNMIEVERQTFEIARLRTLIKQAERSDHAETASGAGAFCPWCAEEGAHAADCSAFTPEGEVR